MSKKPEKKDDIELRSDGWERFEKAVDAAVKSGPKHRKSEPAGASKRAPAKRKKAGSKSG